MQYFGGKCRTAKYLNEFLNTQLVEEQSFVDLFMGSGNVISGIKGKRVRIGNDKHPYLMEMWKALQLGWLPPEEISRDEYQHIKTHVDEDPALSGFVGFACSFGGIWFSSYAKGDYLRKSQASTERNYALSGKKKLMKKFANMKDVFFTCQSYDKVKIPAGSFVYCDIPYKATSGYDESLVGSFDHNHFYSWVRENKDNFDVYVSEYEGNLPEDFETIWRKEAKRDMNNGKGNWKTVEIVGRLKK